MHTLRKDLMQTKLVTVGETIIYEVRALFWFVWLRTLFFYKEDEEVCLIISYMQASSYNVELQFQADFATLKVHKCVFALQVPFMTSSSLYYFYCCDLLPLKHSSLSNATNFLASE